MLKHSGGRPYQCKQCNFSSAQSGPLNAHNSKKHKLALENIKMEDEVKEEDDAEEGCGKSSGPKIESWTLAPRICKAELGDKEDGEEEGGLLLGL